VAGHRHHRREEGEVAARRDRDVGGLDPARIEGAEVLRVGRAEVRIAADRPVLRRAGRRTASPWRATVIIAAKKARLKPALTSMSAGSLRPA
jgi:hypothetical protein